MREQSNTNELCWLDLHSNWIPVRSTFHVPLYTLAVVVLAVG